MCKTFKIYCHWMNTNMEHSTQHLKTVWDIVANDYYLKTHRTTRIFAKIIHNYLKEMISKLQLSGLYLDLGGGRGRLKELYNDNNFSIITGDISRAMMDNTITKSNCYIQMDAFKSPFKDSTFDGVFSLLGDSYALPEVFREVLRILNPTGFFFIALPTKRWAENLRLLRGIDVNQTLLKTKNGKLIKIPSFVYDVKNLQRILLDIGFKQVETGEWRPLNLIPRNRFSNDILVVAKKLNMPPEDLPLIAYDLAFKQYNAWRVSKNEKHE